MAIAPSANDLTRQQLDELDALLQRMLALPTNALETSAATPAPSQSTWRTDPPAPTLAAAMRQLAPPLPHELPRVRPPESNVFASLPFANSIPAPEPTIPVSDRRGASVPATLANPFSALQRPAPTATEYLPIAAPHEPAPWFLYPLVGFNWCVDAVLGLCGPPGWMLRSAFGKNLLGLVGFGLLGYTTAHVASQQGWITLPVPLPWPR